MSKPVTNMTASVLERLRAVAKDRSQPVDLLLIRYALERRRLSTTEYRDRFVLKGAVLMTTWFENAFRPTRDLDLLGFGESAPDALLAIFRNVCAIKMDDGVVFDVDALNVDRIREELEYGGLRLQTTAYLGRARIKVSIDIGFGDATEPGLEDMDLPVMLGLPAPHLRAYAMETVIAEKFQAMVMLGRANSRMKDYYDIWMLSATYTFEAVRLASAIGATFERRDTEIPAVVPDGLSAAFAADTAKQRQWQSFVANIEAEAPGLDAIVGNLATFLMPHALAARARRT